MLLIILTMAMFTLNNTESFPHDCINKEKQEQESEVFIRELNAEQRLWDEVDPM
jgi:hypothetical protein